MPSDYSHHWSLDPAVTFLNHGSFGACPSVVLEAQQEYRDRMERQPVKFLLRDLEGLLDESRAELGAFLGADPRDLAFVPNATAGVNAVLRSLEWRAGDELLSTDQDYGACLAAARYVSQRSGAKAVVAPVPFPVESEERIIEAVMAAVTPRTRLVMLSHVTSPTGILFPVKPLVDRLAERGIDTLVDGAHAPGMIDLDLNGLGAAYYTGNCHKWICAPRNAAFLWVRRDKQPGIHPTTISHGYTSARTSRSRFLMEFDWIGTGDPTAALAIPAAIRFLQKLMPGGLEQLARHNRDLALRGRRMLCQTLGIAPPCPDSMIGSLAAVPLPDEPDLAGLKLTTDQNTSPIAPLQDALWYHHRIEVPIFSWPAAPRRLLRISMQAYSSLDDVQKLCDALRKEL